jgi:hypothetical protein
MNSIFPPEIGAELIYSFVIIACSLIVYHATKEMYELSSYKGIKFFRHAFLFFAIAYFSRYFIQFILVSLSLNSILEFSPFFIGWISLLVFLYSSSMAIFSLLHSIMWKKWGDSKSRSLLFHFLAIVIALVGLSVRGAEMYLLLNVIILGFACFVLFVAYKDSKKKNKEKSLFIIYLLLSIFWVLNIIDILLPSFLELFQLIIYLISISLFMAILYKVLKKIGN